MGSLWLLQAAFLTPRGKRSAASSHVCPLISLEHFCPNSRMPDCVLSFCGFQYIAHGICIKWQLWRNPHGVRLKINGQCLLFYFSSVRLVPEYPTLPWDLQFNSDTLICKRWLMNMRFQGRSLSVTWDLCRHSYYSFPPLYLLQKEYESQDEGLLYL